MSFSPVFSAELKNYLGATNTEINNGNLQITYSDGSVQDLGPISAYAIAVANGYLGTEAEWTKLQSDSATNAQKTQQMKEEAENTAAIIKGYLDAAEYLRQQTEQNAEDAQDSAEDAEESAEKARSYKNALADAVDQVSSNKEDIEYILNMLKAYYGGTYDVYLNKLIQRQMSEDIVVEMWLDDAEEASK